MQILGTALLLVGGLWTLQGLGLLSWPSQSFMLGDRNWAFYGLAAVAFGLFLLWLTREKAGPS